MIPPKLVEQRIPTTPVERAILQRRFNAAVEAARLAQMQHDIASDVFAMLCERHALPGEADFVRIDGDTIVVRVPSAEQLPDAPDPPQL